MKRQRQDFPQQPGHMPDLPQDLGLNAAQGMYGFDPSMALGPMAGGGMGAFGTGVGMEPMFPCVKLRGLPFEVNEDDIRMFLGLDPVDILLVKRDGRFSGEAFVVLGSPVHVEVALSKHKMFLGSRYVEVIVSKKMDYYRAVTNEMAGGGAYPMGGRGRGGMGPGGMGPGGMGMGMEQMSGYNAMPGAYGDGGMGGGMGPGMGGGMGGGGMGGGGGPGTTWVKLRGLPFSVTVEDIVGWFDDPSLGLARLDPSRVFLWNDAGRPTGMALVDFPSAQEATYALSKNKQNLGSRYIELFPATRADLEKFQMRTGQMLPNVAGGAGGGVQQ